MINWKCRMKNKVFWVTLIPLILVLVKQALGIFGIDISIENLSNQLVNLIGTIFCILAAVGIVADPTTEGVSDSELAMTYEEPKGADYNE